jgi:hypothetical protein
MTAAISSAPAKAAAKTPCLLGIMGTLSIQSPRCDEYRLTAPPGLRLIRLLK